MKTKFNGILTLLFALIVQISFAQERTISGTVTDDTGALPGVSILKKGTSIGTETDFDGKYSIKAKTGEILVFSFVGMTTVEKTITASNQINVTMAGDNLLDEVVVTALGIKREKKSLGFAQQSVDTENLTQTREVDINNSIAGKVAGVQILGSPSTGFGNALIRLRGESDLLYVVDGVKVESSGDINTDDIEDLSVLKGSAATALFGPIGKNGVVVITSKKGKNGKTSITLDQSLQVSNVFNLPSYQNEYGGGYEQVFSTLNGQLTPNYAADASWGPELDGTLVRHWDSWIPGSSEYGELRPWSASPDNVEDFFNTGLTSNTTLAFSKGGDGYSVKTILRNVDIEGVMPNSGRDLKQLGASASFDVNDKLTVYTNLNYQYRTTINDPVSGYNSVASNFNQWWQRQIDIDRLRSNDYQNGQFYTWNLRSASDTSPQYWDSPFFETDQNTKNETKNATFGNVGLNYEVNDKLSFNVEIRRSVNSYGTNERVAFGGLNLTSYEEKEQTISTSELFAMATYKTDLTDKLDLTATAGTELRQWQDKYIEGATSGGLTIPGIYTVASSQDRPVYTNREFNEKNRGIFSTVSFGYNDILFIDGSVRSDWNSRASRDNNSVLTFGGSGSFLFHKLIDSEALSFGKLRLGYAQAPSFPDLNSLDQTFVTGNSYNGTVPFYPTSTQANSSLEGGTRTEFEIGTELQFFSNRLRLDFTYFDRKDINLPINIPISQATGYSSSSVNSGKFSSNGVEVALSGTPIKNENFTWDIGINFATLKRTVDELYINPETGEEITSDVLVSSWRGLNLEARTGEEWGAFYGRKIQRDANGNMLLDNSGTIQYDENQYLGNLLPDFTGGLTNTFSYKGINLSFNIDFQKGGKYFSVSQMFGHYSGLLDTTVGNNALNNPVRNVLNGTNPLDSDGIPITSAVFGSSVNSNSGGVLVSGVDSTTGAEASYYVEPQAYWTSLFALHEKWIYDASYIKLRQISLGYDLPAKMLENTFVEGISVNVFANNVLLIYSEVDGVDPSEIEDTNGFSTTGSGYRWAEGGQLPSSRTIGMNVKFKF